MPQASLDKILKTLEQRLLIKTVRSVGSKTKKLYLLYDITPAKELTGGPWYTDQEFDHEFVEALCKFILQLIQFQVSTDIATISDRVVKSGLTTVELSAEELEIVLETLIFDGKVEKVCRSFYLMCRFGTCFRYPDSGLKVNPSFSIESRSR